MGRILETINSPADVKRLSLPELQQLASEVREELITVLSRTGGHLGPNLGVVELTIALRLVRSRAGNKGPQAFLRNLFHLSSARV